MASAKATIELDASADEVWELIGGFGSLPDWLPYIPKSEVTNGGRVRHLGNPGGEAIVERLEKFDFVGRSYSYSIMKAPFPVVGYLAKISVTEGKGGEGAHVEWAATFTPKGVSDKEAHELFQRIFSDGLKALSDRYAKKK